MKNCSDRADIPMTEALETYCYGNVVPDALGRFRAALCSNSGSSGGVGIDWHVLGK